VILTYIYQAILLLFCAILVWEIFAEKKFLRQLTVVVVLIPMILRLLMIK